MDAQHRSTYSCFSILIFELNVYLHIEIPSRPPHPSKLCAPMYGVELRVDSQYPIKCPYGMRMPMASDSKNPAPDLHAMARFRTNRRRDDRRVPGVLNPDLPPKYSHAYLQGYLKYLERRCPPPSKPHTHCCVTMEERLSFHRDTQMIVDWGYGMRRDNGESLDYCHLHVLCFMAWASMILYKAWHRFLRSSL